MVNGLLAIHGTTSRVLLGLIFGAMMSVDMGGPVNKAAYVIGTGALATGEYGIMAAVMAGGMVPLLAIALCTTFFPSRFTEAERKSGITNYIMGLSFIIRRCYPICSSRPSSRIASLHHRCWYSWCVVHVLRMYTTRSSRRYLRSTNNR